MLCKSDQVDAPISSRVGGHALLYASGTVSLTDLGCFRFFLLPEDDDASSLRIRCNASVSADFVSSHAGRSQSSPPPLIDLSNDDMPSLLE